jgi:hypothetical protein
MGVGLLLESISFKERRNTRFEDLTAVFLNILLFRCVTPCLYGAPLQGLLDPRKPHYSISREVGSCPPNDTTPRPKMLESSQFKPVKIFFGWGVPLAEA